jgi:hypothetical protein
MPGRLALLAALALLSGATSAQGITGKWTASVDTAQGQFPLAFEFVAEGTKLMGSMMNDFLGNIPIAEGRINGNKLSFKMAIDAIPGASMDVSFTGEVNGDELTLTSKIEGDVPPGTATEQTMVAKRAENP